MSEPIDLPFSVISFGNGQLIACLPRGPEHVEAVTKFAREYPECFQKFFPTVDVDLLAQGYYNLIEESGDESTPPTSPTPSGADDDDDNDDSNNHDASQPLIVVRPRPPTPKLLGLMYVHAYAL